MIDLLVAPRSRAVALPGGARRRRLTEAEWLREIDHCGLGLGGGEQFGGGVTIRRGNRCGQRGCEVCDARRLRRVLAPAQLRREGWLWWLCTWTGPVVGDVAQALARRADFDALLRGLPEGWAAWWAAEWPQAATLEESVICTCGGRGWTGERMETHRLCEGLGLVRPVHLHAHVLVGAPPGRVAVWGRADDPVEVIRSYPWLPGEHLAAAADERSWTPSRAAAVEAAGGGVQARRAAGVAWATVRAAMKAWLVDRQDGVVWWMGAAAARRGMQADVRALDQDHVGRAALYAAGDYIGGAGGGSGGLVGADLLRRAGGRWAGSRGAAYGIQVRVSSPGRPGWAERQGLISRPPRSVDVQPGPVARLASVTPYAKTPQKRFNATAAGVADIEQARRPTYRTIQLGKRAKWHMCDAVPPERAFVGDAVDLRGAVGLVELPGGVYADPEAGAGLLDGRELFL